MSIVLLCFTSTAVLAEAEKKKGLVTLSNRDSGTEVTIALGNTLQIELERPGAAGYEWHLSDSYKNNFVLLKAGTKSTAKKGLVGAPVLKTWLFKAVKSGTAGLTISLYRDWEGQENTRSQFRVKAIIP